MSRRTGGFTLIEVLVSISVLLLGVMTAGGVMVATHQTSRFTENRYRDYADIRNRLEDFEVQASSLYPSGYTASGSTITLPTTSLGVAPLYSGQACSTTISVGAASLPNLVRVAMTVTDPTARKPIQVITYVRSNEKRNLQTN